jgi:opacity protein-like surface antigen
LARAGLMLLLALCMSSAAHAQDAAQRQGAQVRLLVGPSYLDASQDVGAAEAIGAAGLGYAAQLSIGVMVTDSLALNSELAFARSDAAEHEVLGETSVTALFVGLGATYWLLPADVYFAGSFGATRSSIEGAPLRVQIEVPQSDASEIGFGVQLSLGKVFAVTPGVGLGLALSGGFATASNPVSGVDSNRQVWTALLALAATIG